MLKPYTISVWKRGEVIHHVTRVCVSFGRTEYVKVSCRLSLYFLL